MKFTQEEAKALMSFLDRCNLTGRKEARTLVYLENKIDQMTEPEKTQKDEVEVSNPEGTKGKKKE